MSCELNRSFFSSLTLRAWTLLFFLFSRPTSCSLLKLWLFTLRRGIFSALTDFSNNIDLLRLNTSFMWNRGRPCSALISANPQQSMNIALGLPSIHFELPVFHVNQSFNTVIDLVKLIEQILESKLSTSSSFKYLCSESMSLDLHLINSFGFFELVGLDLRNDVLALPLLLLGNFCQFAKLRHHFIQRLVVQGRGCHLDYKPEPPTDLKDFLSLSGS